MNARDLQAVLLDAMPRARLPDRIEAGRLIRFSSDGRPGDLAGWLRVHDDGHGIEAGDWRTGRRLSWRADAPARPMTRAEHARIEAARAAREAAEVERRRRNARRLRALWRRSHPIEADGPVARYLTRRGLAAALPLLDPAEVREVGEVAYFSGGHVIGRFAAMVCLVRAADGKPATVHVTHLAADGGKAPVDPVRKLLPVARPFTGGAIRLTRQHGPVLAVGEGAESVLAGVVAADIPGWAAVCAGGLAAFQWPPSVRRLVALADHDDAGLRAAHALRERAQTAGLSVRVVAPSVRGADWNDVIRSERAREAGGEA